MVCFFGILMDVELDCQSIEIVELLHGFDIIGLCKLQLHL